MAENNQEIHASDAQTMPSLLIRGGINFWRLRITYRGKDIEIGTDYEAAATLLFHLMGDPRSPDIPPVGIEPFWNACHVRRASFRPRTIARYPARLMEVDHFPAMCSEAWCVFALCWVADGWELSEQTPSGAFKGPADYFTALARLRPLLKDAVPFRLPSGHDEDDYDLAVLVLKRAAQTNPDLLLRPKLPHEDQIECQVASLQVPEDAGEWVISLEGPKGLIARIQTESRKAACTLFQTCCDTADRVGALIDTPPDVTPLPAQVDEPAEPRAGSLRAVLHHALQDNAMSIEEAARAVRAAGYKTRSRNFVSVVQVALCDRTHFRRVARGRYRAKLVAGGMHPTGGADAAASKGA